MTKIIVTIEGGIVQDVSGMPPGVTVEVWDFDTEGFDDLDLFTNEAGEQYTKAIWGRGDE